MDILTVALSKLFEVAIDKVFPLVSDLVKEEVGKVLGKQNKQLSQIRGMPKVLSTVLLKKADTLAHKPALEHFMKLYRVYLEQELLAISNHYITTEFIVYAQIVKELLESVKGQPPECITVLCLPPYRWFNFSEDLVSGRRIYAVDDRWEDYKKLLYDNFRKSPITRYILAVSDVENPLITKALTLNEQLNSYILVNTDWQDKGPCYLNENEIEEFVTKLNQKEDIETTVKDEIIKRIKGHYKNHETYVNKAYLIFPSSSVESIYNKSIKIGGSKYKFETLRNVFSTCYHSGENRFRPVIMSREIYRRWFESPPTPKDFFKFGRDFCLAADVDQALDKLKLWFLNYELDNLKKNGKTFSLTKIDEFVRDLESCK